MLLRYASCRFSRQLDVAAATPCLFAARLADKRRRHVIDAASIRLTALLRDMPCRHDSAAFHAPADIIFDAATLFR